MHKEPKDRPRAGFRGWEEVEHAADIGLRAEGGSMQELFLNAAGGMIALMLDPSQVRPRERRAVSAEGRDAESLLVGWLEEILVLRELEGFVPRDAACVRIEGGRVAGDISGEPLDARRHEARHWIKAVTWHDLKIRRKGGRFSVVIIFDV